MTKKVTREIMVSQQSTKNPDGVSPISVLVKTKRLLSSDDGIKLSDKIAALILGQQLLQELKNQVENLEEQFEEAKYEEITEALVKEGALFEGETPIFTIVDKTGTKVSKILGKTTSHILNMDDFKELIKDPSQFTALPEEFKKTDIKGKPFFSSLYKEGKIPEIYSDYFRMVDEEKTTLKTIKTKEEK